MRKSKTKPDCRHIAFWKTRGIWSIRRISGPTCWDNGSLVGYPSRNKVLFLVRYPVMRAVTRPQPREGCLRKTGTRLIAIDFDKELARPFPRMVLL